MTFNQNPDHGKPPSVLTVINNNLAGFYGKSASLTGELV
jgi:hypothetical protein